MRRCRNKCCSRDGDKNKLGFEVNPNLRVKNTIKRIVNGRYVLTIMTFVTIFALIGVSTFIFAGLASRLVAIRQFKFELQFGCNGS